MMRHVLIPLVLTLAACEERRPNTFQGYAEGEFVRVAAPFAGSLQQLNVQRGTEVKAGDPLFSLEQQNEVAAREEAQGRLRAAIAQLDDLRKGKRPPEIEAVRGVDSSGVLATLHARELIEPVSRLAAIGNPFQYGTTVTFLKLFGLTSLADLPPLGQFEGEDGVALLARAMEAGDEAPPDHESSTGEGITE